MGSWRWQSRESNRTLVIGPITSNDSSSSADCCSTCGFLFGRAHVERAEVVVQGHWHPKTTRRSTASRLVCDIVGTLRVSGRTSAALCVARSYPAFAMDATALSAAAVAGQWHLLAGEPAANSRSVEHATEIVLTTAASYLNAPLAMHHTRLLHEN